MGIYNEILVGRFNRHLQKLCSMKGPASMNELASTLQPSISVFSGTEDRYLEGWQRFGFNIAVAAVVGQKLVIQIRNPVGSNVVAVLERARAVMGLADSPFLLLDSAPIDYTISVGGRRLDARGPAKPVCILSSGTLVSAPVTSGQIDQVGGVANSSADFIVTDIQELPLLPGDAYLIFGNTVNQANGGSFQWRERFLEDSERT